MVTATATAVRHSHATEPQIQSLSPGDRQVYLSIPEEVDFVAHPSFQQDDAESRYFGPAAEVIEVTPWAYFPEVPEDTDTVRKPKRTLGSKREAALFLRYNYARCRLAQLQAGQSKRWSLVRAKEMVVWHRRATRDQDMLVQANLALVVAMAKRTRIPNVEFSELISEGNMALLRSVDKFDVSRGFKFSTYACRAILKSYNRMASKSARYHQRFPTDYDPDLEKSDHDATLHQQQHDDTVDALRDVMTRNRAHLTELERTIVRERFALGAGPDAKGHTLQEVGHKVGLTNERVRQIQNLALAKLRAVLDAAGWAG